MHVQPVLLESWYVVLHGTSTDMLCTTLNGTRCVGSKLNWISIPDHVTIGTFSMIIRITMPVMFVRVWVENNKHIHLRTSKIKNYDNRNSHL